MYKFRSMAVFMITVSLIMAISLTGCGKENSSSSLPKQETLNATIGSDLLDPENADLGDDTGTSIDATHLNHRVGKANGIDVSKWQGKIDWSQVRASGIEFAIIRVGYRAENGKIYKDSYADYNLQQAEKAGILLGVYFFSTAVNISEANEEAEWTVSAIQGYPISFPVVYDCEGFMSPNSRMNLLTNSQRTDNAMAFLEKITNSGYEGMFYAAQSELEESAYWDTAKLESSYKIWVARYTQITYPEKPNPDYNGKYDMWQYTNMGRVGGINGNTDLVVSYFTREKAEPKNPSANSGKATVPLDNITYSATNDSVTAKEVTNLRDAASTKSNIVATLKNGEFVQRNGIGSNGWSRINYNGKIVYAITSYLTTDSTYKPPSSTNQTTDDGFTAADGKVTAKETVNLRSKPSTSGDIVATITNGEFVTRTGTGRNGWTRIDYNGQTVYAITSYLTTEVNPPPSSVPQVTNEITFTETNEQVTAKIETNLRTVPDSKDNSTIVYTLKNGEYVTRTGISDNNEWSRLEYNGQIVYAKTSLLTQ